MHNPESSRESGMPGDEMAGRQQRHSRGPDRREDGGSLFGYSGPERRSGRDRRKDG